MKQIHHEPCDYYQFGNKIEAEKKDYERLRSTGIRMPKMLALDENKERILKEYIEGPTIYDLILNDKMKDDYIAQVKEMCRKLYPMGINIDYFPTNFVVQGDEIWRNGILKTGESNIGRKRLSSCSMQKNIRNAWRCCMGIE